jgi:hypothetical protein
MPVICEFYGIQIRLNFNDHNPPHFHVKYSEFMAMISIDTLHIIEGQLPPRAEAMVIDWAMIHRDELMKDWELARSHKTLFKIDPLP